MTGGFVIEPLDAQDRKRFACGAESLDSYLRERASQDVKRFMASCFVLVETQTNSIAGYYTLSASSVPAGDLPAESLKRLPRYPVLPAALIGRLAVDLRFQKRGFASALLADAALRVMRSDTRAFALIVDAKDETAAGFYQALGFRAFSSRPQSLFLPIATAMRILSGEK
ncbi:MULTISPECIES: GNAT family N-acetyltransferase [Methylosinus]|uniref:GNAT family N-acetyltransferase n=1 Tax=Methylosinus trichosporium (strain ATCC 35070 / NCIMB 11131 / UNIQEM 75 / OB3b) TaxID=595536 RepID=A0A2D2CZS6_METT3|nr:MULTISPECIES: GNAT family N-acetyltransferase [Methylosinus]ATQ68194.1 GNAT family N-acetyltransferase [Methylosinus trichosporium OB3b]OBS53460.1 GCN5 family acetyltransferase [Methylosinus sp. 3S-1]